MKDVHDIFTFYNIEYWIQGGTLVGALRHKGLMLWDDDFDINVKITDFPSIFQLQPMLEKLRYYLLIYPNFMLKIGTWSLDGCWVDVFPTYHDSEKTTYVNHWWKRDRDPLYIYDTELYPLRLYQFGKLQLWGPCDPHSYLKCGFGDNYMKEVLIYNHKIENPFQCDFDDLSMKFREAAISSIELIDRVKQLNLEKKLLNKDFQLNIVTH